MIAWYTFEMKKDSNWAPYVGDAFDTSLDPVKMPQIVACALMYLRDDLDPATGVSVQALDGSGHALGQPIPARKTAAGWETPVGEPVTTWYEVSVAR